jgi:two-component system, chemotaxis family, protein-glutamate methylesterase/glutaminase
LRRASCLRVTMAEDGMVVLPGVIHVAPGHAHLSLARGLNGNVEIRHSSEACLHGGVPAVDPMFQALGRIYGSGACGIILSGMGRDGLAGANAIVESGGWVVAQDHASSAVWGMPGSIAKAGLASAILPPRDIAEYVVTQRRAAS